MHYLITKKICTSNTRQSQIPSKADLMALLH